jgi:hypothetical protein
LFYLVGNRKNTDVGLLGPTDYVVVHNLKAAHLALTFREHQGLLDLSRKTEHVETVISCDDEGVFGNEEAAKGFLLDR